MPVTETADIVEDLPDMAEVHEGGQLGREGQVEPETGPTLVDDVVMEEAGQDEWQLKGEVETHQDDLQSSDSPAALNLPQSDAEPQSPQCGWSEEQITDSQSSPSTPLRRSIRRRRPRPNAHLFILRSSNIPVKAHCKYGRYLPSAFH